MRTNPRRLRSRLRGAPAVALALVLGVAASATVVHAAGSEPDGTHLRAQLAGGGDAELELDTRNERPVICFVWRSDAPQDGDGIASRILTRAGAVVVDLGSGDQWVDGSGHGCEVPRDGRYRDVFAHPGAYVVEVRVVENQRTAPTPPLRSEPLRRSSG